MKLVITTPKKDPQGYCDTWDHELLRVGLLNEGIYIGDYLKDFSIKWNYFYKNYDIILYEKLENGGKARTSHWDRFEYWLQENGYKYKVMNTYKWKNPLDLTDHIEIRGRRFWVYPNEK